MRGEAKCAMQHSTQAFDHVQKMCATARAMLLTEKLLPLLLLTL
jgi:hypothetical protein